MSNCLLTAFKAHMRYMNLEPAKHTDTIFHALRSPTLPAKQANFSTGYSLSNLMGNTRQVERRIQLTDLSYTHGSVAPLILHVLASYNGLAIKGQYAKGMGSMTMSELATTQTMKYVADTSEYFFGDEVKVIDLEPAIYLCLDGFPSKHAQFGRTIPQEAFVAGAFQLTNIYQK